METDNRIEYEPRSVKTVLSEMKDTAELLIDLSYSSVLFESPDLAEEVLKLESEMDVLQLQAWMSLVMAGRSPEEAEDLAPVFGIVGAAEKISDAAGDIAKVVHEDIGLPSALRVSLPEAIQTLARAVLTAESRYANRTLGEINLETETGVRVLCLRRNNEWTLNPGRDTRLRPGDILFCRGPREGIEHVYETVTGNELTLPGTESPSIDDLDRAVETIVLMKNMSELAVDLAYGSVLFDSADLAEEVRELEVEVDALKARFEAWALRAAGDVDDPVSIRGLVHIASSTEVISDAAVEISEGVLRGFGSHPVVEAAVEESDKILVRLTIEPDSHLAGITIGDAAVRTQTGMHIVAIRRASAGDGRTRYLLSPPPETELNAGDVLIAKGTRAGADRLADLTE